MTAMPSVATGPSAREFTRELFRRVDALDAGPYARLFAPEARLSFANNPPLTGPDEIERGMRGFFATIAGVRHTIVDEWQVEGTVIVELAAAHVRRDGQQVTIPVAVIYRRDADGLIAEMRVFADLGPVLTEGIVA